MNAFIKSSSEKQMSLEKEINKNGFIFRTLALSEEHRLDILQSKEPSSEIIDTFLQILKSFDPLVNSIHCVYEDIKQGMYHEMHSHLTPSRYQAVVWFPKDAFLGRQFLYGKKDNIKKFTPRFNDICFMKTNDLDYIHGVALLETDTLVRTLLISIDHITNLGEHLTVSANDFRGI